MKLSRLKQIAEKSRGQLSPMHEANCKKTLKNYSFAFNVKFDELQKATEDYFKAKYNQEASISVYQLTKRFVNREGDYVYSQRAFFHLEVSNNPLEREKTYMLFSCNTSDKNIADEDFSINLLTTGFIKSMFQPHGDSDIPCIEDDLNQIGWNCIAYSIKQRLAKETIAQQNI